MFLLLVRVEAKGTKTQLRHSLMNGRVQPTKTHQPLSGTHNAQFLEDSHPFWQFFGRYSPQAPGKVEAAQGVGRSWDDNIPSNHKQTSPILRKIVHSPGFDVFFASPSRKETEAFGSTASSTWARVN